MESKISKDTQEKIMQMQLLQQRLQVFAQQKQQFQIELLEIENALSEVKLAKKPVYKLVGGILVEKSAGDVAKELTEQKKEIELKLKSFDKQEEANRKKAEDLQKEVAKELK